MQVTSEYYVRLGRRVLEHKRLDSASALFADLDRRQWLWVITFINNLVTAQSVGVEHPKGKPWRFVARFNFVAVKSPQCLQSVWLMTWPKVGDYQVPPIRLQPNFNPEELRRWLAASPAAVVS